MVAVCWHGVVGETRCVGTSAAGVRTYSPRACNFFRNTAHRSIVHEPPSLLNPITKRRRIPTDDTDHDDVLRCLVGILLMTGPARP